MPPDCTSCIYILSLSPIVVGQLTFAVHDITAPPGTGLSLTIRDDRENHHYPEECREAYGQGQSAQKLQFHTLLVISLNLRYEVLAETRHGTFCINYNMQFLRKVHHVAYMHHGTKIVAS